MASMKQPKTQVYEGNLYKQGKVNKAWKKRFFVLYSDRTLAYFKTEQDWDKGKPQISHIDLSATRSIAPVNKKMDSKVTNVEKQMKKMKSRRGSLSRKWSIDFSAIFSNKKGNDSDDENESDNEDDDGAITFIEVVLNQQFTFEVVQAKRTYNLCTDDPTKFNKWLSKLETVTFGKKVYKGWLLKQSERNKKWDKRWFIIYNTNEMRYFDNQSKAVSRGMAILTQLKKVTKMDDERSKKKYKQLNVLKLEFKQRTMLLSCSPSDDRRIWFDKICRMGGPSVRYIDAIYDDYLYRYDEKATKWKKYWFLLDQHSLYQFRDMDSCDEYCKHGYFDGREHEKAFKKYVMEEVVLVSSEYKFDPKSVQKIRPGSNLQKKLIKECIFIMHSKTLGKLFFATEQQNQLNRWFKKIRSLAGDHGKRSSSRGQNSVMSESSMADSHMSVRSAKSSRNGRTKGGGTEVMKNGRTKGQNQIMKMLKELESDLKECKRDVKFVKECWEKNNESGDEDDSKYDDRDDSEY